MVKRARLPHNETAAQEGNNITETSPIISQLKKHSRGEREVGMQPLTSPWYIFKRTRTEEGQGQGNVKASELPGVEQCAFQVCVISTPHSSERRTSPVDSDNVRRHESASGCDHR